MQPDQETDEWTMRNKCQKILILLQYILSVILL